MAEDDDKWWQALADAGAAADEPTQREHQALRRAARALEDGGVDELAERRLLQRLEAEGLLPKKHARQRIGLRTMGRAAVMLLCVGLLLEWFVIPPPGSEDMAESLRPPPAAPAERRKLEQPQHDVQRRAAPAEDTRQRVVEEGAIAPAASESLRAQDAPAMDRAPQGQSLADESKTLRVSVADLAQARAELAALLEDPAIERLEPADDSTPADWQLVCRSEVACARLNGWLEEQGAAPAFSPGQALQLRLRGANEQR